MALKGTLKDFGIADILQLIGQQQKTGTLHLRSKTEQVQVGFKDGSIVKAESATRKRRDLIGGMLVRAELISEEQLERALETQRRTLKRLGDILVAENVITRERFTQVVRLQTTETLYRLFAWKSGTYEFVGDQVEFDPEMSASLRAESVLMEGFRMVDEWPVIKRTIASYELTFERLKQLPPAPPEEDVVDDAFDDAFAEPKKSERGGEFKSIGAHERRVFEFIRPGRDVRTLIDVALIGEFETCKALLNLVNLGYLKANAAATSGNEVGFGRADLADRVLGPAGRLVATAAVLAALAFVVSRANLEAIGPTGSSTSFADTAAQRVIAKAQLARIESALGVYRLETGALPDGLDRLVEAGLLDANDLRYPWRDRYFYRTDAQGGFVLLPPLR
jgi:hypothetical protein